MPKKRPICLIILDGWGVGPADQRNALAKAGTPNLDGFRRRYPHSTLRADGRHVGLPEGNQGNSEVGHLNIGTGRILEQMLVRIDNQIESGEFYENEALRGAVDHCRRRGTNLHLIGLVNDQGVHSVTRHANALLVLCEKMEFDDVYVHAFTDGRDTPPSSATACLEELQQGIERAGRGKVAVVVGRYWAMDRDTNWDRIRVAYDGMTRLQGIACDDWRAAIADAYAAGETDEFIRPRIVGDFPGIREGDAVINFNYRLDRAREITHAFTDSDFEGFERERIDLHYVGFTSYYDDGDFKVAFPPVKQAHILGQVLSEHGLTQLRCAETEKYAHVTFFFNDSDETPFPREERVLVASPKVATYDLQPEMSALEVRDRLLDAVASDGYDVIICNFANGDMVGHTGVFDAVVKAAEAVDMCVGAVADAVLRKGGAVLITADHGNAECMFLDDGSPMTAHTTNPVPLILCGLGDVTLRRDGRLCDIAPTILEILDIDRPPEMTGIPLY